MKINEILSKEADSINLFHQNRFGFSRGRSTEGAFYKLVSGVRSNLTAGHSAVVISFEIKGAFDTCRWSANIEILNNFNNNNR